MLTGEIEVWEPQLRELLDDLLEVAFIAGGAARQALIEDAPPAMDIDFFLFRDKDYQAVAEHVAELGYAFLGETDNAVSFEGRAWSELPGLGTEPRNSCAPKRLFLAPLKTVVTTRTNESDKSHRLSAIIPGGERYRITC